MTDRGLPSKNHILLVEGKSDLHVVVHICKQHECTPPCISNKESIDKLLQSIGPEINVSERQTVGILVDANDDLDARWNSVRDKLLKNGVKLPSRPVPDGTIIDTKGKPRVGIWLMATLLQSSSLGCRNCSSYRALKIRKSLRSIR